MKPRRITFLLCACLCGLAIGNSCRRYPDDTLSKPTENEQISRWVAEIPSYVRCWRSETIELSPLYLSTAEKNLLQAGEKAVPYLLEVAETEKYPRSHYAMRLLRLMALPSSREAIQRLMLNKGVGPLTKVEATLALGEIGDIRAIPTIWKGVEENCIPEILAHFVCAQLGDKEAVKKLQLSIRRGLYADEKNWLDVLQKETLWYILRSRLRNYDVIISVVIPTLLEMTIDENCSVRSDSRTLIEMVTGVKFDHDWNICDPEFNPDTGWDWDRCPCIRRQYEEWWKENKESFVPKYMKDYPAKPSASDHSN